jgi:hypothetical protein
MFSLRLPVAGAMLALGLLLLALPAPAGERVERVAVLYAADNQALYRINPDTGEFTKIGDLQLIPNVMTYDPKTERLYAIQAIDGPNAPPSYVFSIDPQTAEEKKASSPEFVGEFRLGEVTQAMR